MILAVRWSVIALWMVTYPILSGVQATETPASNPVGTLIKNVAIVKGDGSPATGPVDVFLQGESIREVAEHGKVRLPAGGRLDVVDGRGKTLIPGLISAHSHLGQTDGTGQGPMHFTRDNVSRQLRQYETYGVTTVVSLGTNLPLIYELKKESEAGELTGASFLGADYGIGGVQGAPGAMLIEGADNIPRPANEESARQAVREAKDRGTDFIKIWVDTRSSPSIPVEIYTAIIDQAHAVGLKVFAHVYSLADAKQLVKSGVDVIAHGVRDQPVDQEFIELMKSNQVWYIPTIALDESFYIYADRPEWFETDFFLKSLQPDLRKQIFDEAWRSETLKSPRTQAARDSVAMNVRNLAFLHKAEVQIAFGTDSGAFPLRIPGFAEHRELELMAQSGVTPLEAITIATSNSAKVLGLSDRGLIEAGKRADLILLDTDPELDIRNLQKINAVWHRGNRAP